MKLTTLRSSLPVLNTQRVQVLDTKAGATERIRGRGWMRQRERIGLRDHYKCAACGAIRSDHDVDHRIPLEKGGSNDDSNLQLLCSGPDRCHAKKTAAEAKARAGRGWGS
ncbi:HNH endonuclease [Giesbergeria sinuosa]|uniref:HNH endonuclease n=1 Tax=Giesbergeria sinuosa TaxID=80883 RepID=A0ABV9QAR6_9BURK